MHRKHPARRRRGLVTAAVALALVAAACGNKKDDSRRFDGAHRGAGSDDRRARRADGRARHGGDDAAAARLHAGTGRAGHLRRHAAHRRRGRGRITLDARRGAMRLVLPHAHPHGDRAAGDDRREPPRATVPRRERHARTPTSRCGTSPCARASPSPTARRSNADAVIYNLQATGTGLLVSSAVRTSPASTATPNGPLMIDKTGDMSLRITLGPAAIPSQPLSWPLFANYLTGPVRPDRLPDVARGGRGGHGRGVGDGRHRPVRAPGLLARPVDDRHPQPELLADRPPAATSCRTSTRSSSWSSATRRRCPTPCARERST